MQIEWKMLIDEMVNRLHISLLVIKIFQQYGTH